MPEAGGITLRGVDHQRPGPMTGRVVTRYPYGNVGMDHLLSREEETWKLEKEDKTSCFSFERS